MSTRAPFLKAFTNHNVYPLDGLLFGTVIFGSLHYSRLSGTFCLQSVNDAEPGDDSEPRDLPSQRAGSVTSAACD